MHFNTTYTFFDVENVAVAVVLLLFPRWRWRNNNIVACTVLYLYQPPLQLNHISVRRISRKGQIALLTHLFIIYNSLTIWRIDNIN